MRLLSRVVLGCTRMMLHSEASVDCSEKVGLNTMANEATFRLIVEALNRGVNLTAVRDGALRACTDLSC